MADAWNPAQYQRFQKERAQPFHDLLAGVRPVPGGRVVDLGCGTGELTAELHARLEAAETVGIDNSAAMLDKARAHGSSGLRFENSDIARFDGKDLSVVFSNAALHWVPDHPAYWPRIAGWLAPGGQLAVQMPSNEDHPSHACARNVAGQAKWRERLGGFVRHSPVLPPERYAELLSQAGFSDPRVRLQVYVHTLDDRAGVIEWVKGTLLTEYQSHLTAEQYDEFLADYRAELFRALPDRRPFLYTFKRILSWATRT